ncbi:MAG: hypothetical protein AAGI70_11875, partial [Pseudomonadota bacterium]
MSQRLDMTLKIVSRTFWAAGALALSTGFATAQFQWDKPPQEPHEGDTVVTFEADPDLKQRMVDYLETDPAEAAQVTQGAVPAASASAAAGGYTPPGDELQQRAFALTRVETVSLAVAEQNELVVPRDPHVAAYKTSPFPSAVQCA